MTDRQQLDELIERRNRFFRQRAGLRVRADKLTAKIEALDAEIVAEDIRIARCESEARRA